MKELKKQELLEVNGGETMRCIVQGKVISEAWRTGNNGPWIVQTENKTIEVSAQRFKEDYAWMFQ